MAQAQVVYLRGGRQRARELVYSLRDMLAGRQPDTLGIAAGVFTAVGFAALGDIQRDFVRKSHRQTGEDGVTWQELSPRTIAQRRLGPKDKRLPHIKERLDKEREATKAARQSFTEQANARRKQLAGEYQRLLARFRLSLPVKSARRRAKQALAAKLAVLNDQIESERKSTNFALRGKLAVTKATGTKRVDVLSRREVDILRDTGIGLASLSQGKLDHKGPGATYSKPAKKGGDQQIFKLLADGVVIGTNVPYMAEHQTGDPSKHLPARPFLPERIPPEWAQRWADAGMEALAAGAKTLFEQGA